MTWLSAQNNASKLFAVSRSQRRGEWFSHGRSSSRGVSRPTAPPPPRGQDARRDWHRDDGGFPFLSIILRGAKPNESAGSVFDQVRACHQLEVRRRANQAGAVGPKLAPLFDGTEQLIRITSIPFYSR